MEWRELVGRTIVAAVATRGGVPDETIPNVLHLRFDDGSTAIICCDWASHERPWLVLEEDPEGVDPWLVEPPPRSKDGSCGGTLPDLPDPTTGEKLT